MDTTPAPIQNATTKARFTIHDPKHSEYKGNFATFEDAKTAIIAFTSKRWDEKPNRAPCSSWKTCGREYHIDQYDESGQLVASIKVCKVSAEGVVWYD